MILLFAALAAAQPPFADTRQCQEGRRTPTTAPRPARPETLDRQPDAELYFAVWRSVDRCPRPVKVREERAR